MTEIAQVEPGSRILYAGWRIVFAMFLVTAIVYGVTIYGFILLSYPIAQENGWSAAQSGNLVSAMWAIAPLALLCAPLIERVGPWRLLLSGLALEAVAFGSIVLVSEFWQLYLIRIVMGAAKILAIVSMPVIIARWFSRRFGTAIALAWCGGSFGGLVLSPGTEVLIDAHGWRAATLTLSGLIVATMAAVMWLGRGATMPFQLGLGPDGDMLEEAQHEGEAGPLPAAVKVGWSEIGSINRLTAALMVLAIACSGIGAIAFTIQAPVLMEAIGFSPATAAALLGLTAAGAMAGQILAGWTLDRGRAAWTTLATGGAILVGLTTFHALELAALLPLAVAGALIAGMGLGACEVLWITLTKRQFGIALFAVTYGAWSFSYQIGYAVGGGIGGWIYDSMPHYAFLAAIAAFYMPAIILALWRPAARNEEGPG